MTNSRPSAQQGFSLVELSVVLVILALLSSGLMLGITAQQTVAENYAVRSQLDNAIEALLGFAIRNGRLPCPAAPDTTGAESPVGGGNCSNPRDGILPAITLGIQPVDDKGYAIDPWGNPLRYAVSTSSASACGPVPCLTSEDGIRNTWSDTPPLPDLRICSTATGSTGGTGGNSAECASGKTLTTDAVALVFSRGRNGNRSPSGSDEIANENDDRLFVSHLATLAPNEFDDQFSWISANILYSRLIAAGRLP